MSTLSAVHRRPTPIQAVGPLVLVAVIGLNVGLLARYLEELAPAASSWQAQILVLAQQFGGLVFATAVIARFSPSVGQALSRAALFIFGLGLGRFLLATGMWGLSDLDRFSIDLLPGLMVLPTVSAILWWVSHRAPQNPLPIHLVGGLVLAAPLALLAREAYTLWLGEDIVVASTIGVMFALVTLLLVRSIPMLAATLVGVPLLWVAFDPVWAQYRLIVEFMVEAALG